MVAQTFKTEADLQTPLVHAFSDVARRVNAGQVVAHHLSSPDETNIKVDAVLYPSGHSKDGYVHALALFEFKRDLAVAPDDSQVGEMISKMRWFFRQFPQRKDYYGVISDNRRFRLFQGVRVDTGDDLVLHYSNRLAWAEAGDRGRLAYFLKRAASSDHALLADKRLAFLAHGGTSSVFAYQSATSEPTYVVKVCKKDANFVARERALLEKLAQLDSVKKRVPALLTAAPPGFSTSAPMLWFVDRLQPLPAHEMTGDHVGALVDLVGELGTRGIFHRDIRSANIMKAGDGQLVLIDWGYAVDHEVVDQDYEYAGTPSTAAPRLKLEYGFKYRHTVADEYASIVRVVFLGWARRQGEHVQVPVPHAKMATWQAYWQWRLAESPPTAAWRKIQEAWLALNVPTPPLGAVTSLRERLQAIANQ